MADNSKWKGKNLSYMTPQMLHAMRMSQTQSQNNYKKSYNQDVKGKGSTAVDTVESQRVKKLTTEQSLLNYHKKFEESKSKGYTAVTETPELNRIKQQQTTRDVMYKKEFMEQKGHNIPVAETPESIRVKNQQKFLSDIKYQEDRSKLRGKATQVTDDPQMRRAMQAAKIASDVEYKKNKEKAEEMERRRQEMIAEQQTKGEIHSSLKTSRVAPAHHPAYMQRNVVRHAPVRRWHRQPGSIFDYDPSDYETEQEYEYGLDRRQKFETVSKPYYTDTEDFIKVSTYQPRPIEKVTPWTDYLTGKAYKRVAAPGSVLDYDPVQRMQQMSIQNKPREEPAPTHVSPPQSPLQQEPPKSPQADPEPQQIPQQEQQQPEPQEFVRKSDGHIYKAMYDYSAQDDDEVTFMDGDTIINAQKIDDGWMFGTVERTGQTGMLPSNYVVVMQ